MNKYSLPAILLTGLLFAGCSHSSGLWDKEDIKSILKQQYGDTVSIAVSEGCGNGQVQIAGLPCPQLMAVASKKGGAKTVYYFYSGPVKDVIKKIMDKSFWVPGMRSSGSHVLYYCNTDTVHRKQLVISGVDSTEEKLQERLAESFGLRNPTFTVQDVQLEEIKQEDEKNEPPPPPPPIVDSSAEKKQKKK
jgi:hypothetical protein